MTPTHVIDLRRPGLPTIGTRDIHVLPCSIGVLSHAQRRTIRGATARTIRDAFAAQEWLTDPETTMAIVGGAEWPLDRWDVALPEGLDVVFAPRVALGVVVALVIAVASALITYSQVKKLSLAAVRASDAQNSESASTSWRNAQSTRVGRGYSVPIVVGDIRVAGQLINFESYPSNALDEVYRLDVALSDGPVYSIGGITGGERGEEDDLGSLDGRGNIREIPAGVRLDGALLTKESALVSIRTGRDRHSRAPRWVFSSSIVAIGGELLDVGAKVTFRVDTIAIDRFALVFECPAGLYAQVGTTRVPYTVNLEIRIRKVGETAWQMQPFVISGNRGVSFRVYFNTFPQPPRSGPYEIEVTRLTAAGDPQTTVSQVVWQSVVNYQYQSLTHPGLARIMVDVRASLTRHVSTPTLSVPIKGILVRGWQAVTDPVFTAPGWLPVSPWVYPIGRNPGWIAVQLCLDRNYGAGAELRMRLGGDGSEELDLPSFRRWADNCDRADPLVPGEGYFTCDWVFDVPRPTSEQLLVVFKSGLATPVVEGGKLTVHYEYRDAHGRGTYSVPKREPHQIIASSNCTDFQLIFKDSGTHANIVDIEFHNRELDFAPDFTRVPDENRLLSPFPGAHPRVISTRLAMPGVTNVKKARRHGWYLLQWLSKSKVEGSLTLGLQCIAVTVGDLFRLQHECWFPSKDDPTGSMRCTLEGGGSLSSVVTLDRAIENTVARTDKVLFIADIDGKLRLCTIDGTGVYLPGDTIPLWDPAASGGVGAAAQVKVTRGATVAWGKWGVFDHVMRVDAIQLAPNCMAKLTFSTWVESAFDEPPAHVVEDSGTSDDLEEDSPPAAAAAVPPPTPVAPQARQIGGLVAVSAEPLAQVQAPAGAGRSMALQFYLRRSAAEDFELVQDGRARELQLADLTPERSYEVAVVPQTRGGGFPGPTSAQARTVWVPELHGPVLPAPTGLDAATAGGQTTVAWATVAGAASYEVVRGGRFLGARTLYAGPGARCTLALGPGTHRLRVRAVSAGGRWGRSAAVSVVVAEPLASLGSLVELPTVAGTHAGTEIVDGTLRLAGGALRGTYTTPELAVAAGVADIGWSAIVDWHGRNRQTIAERWGGPLARQSGVPIAGRKPTPFYPGSLAMPLGARGVLRSWGRIRPRSSDLGFRVRVDVEARWWDGAAWSSYAPWSGTFTRVLASKVQLRLTLRRQRPSWTLIVDAIEARASA